MNYYKIALPLNLEQDYTYSSNINIMLGCRVLISFNHKFRTGIVIEQTDIISKKIIYKGIEEVIDSEPIVSREQFELANWMANYYFVPKGILLFAMLPSAIDVNIQQEVRKIRNFDKKKSSEENKILGLFKGNDWIKIDRFKSIAAINKFQYWLESLENDGYIEIKRSFDTKIKKKTINFVSLIKKDEIPILTSRQSEAYNKIKSIGKEFPLSKIAKEISYSIVKALKIKGLIEIKPKEVTVSNKIFPNEKIILPKIQFTGEQKKVINELNIKLDINKFNSVLLHGITGSGKTEIYIEAIKKCLSLKKKALLLVPEISLTPQLLAKFYTLFPDDIAILHSNLNEREKWEQWRKIYFDKCSIVIGVRSAVFAPLKNIGLIIIDEEHETTYKQENNPRYNARDVAIVRAKINQCVIILGSATPSLESFYNSEIKKNSLLELKHRPYKATLPKIEIFDLKNLSDFHKVISDRLAEKIEDRLKKKEQIILFQNRRGHSSFVQCVNCGHLFTCPNCEISYKFHSYDNNLKCHYCGQSIAIPRKCPDCNGYIFKFGSAGTQQVEKQLQVLFQTARIMRMDSDTTTRKDSYRTMFKKMRNGHIDILLGTQMIAKGLDFENVTLVGVVSADTILNFPDFRSSERTFQLLTQVAGRAGRGKKSGEVIIQTYNPEHYAIKFALQQNYHAFIEKELKFRKIMHYPPYFRLARFILSHKNEEFLEKQISENSKHFQMLKSFFSYDDLRILGPTKSPLSKINNEYRHHIIIKARTVKIINQSVNYIRDNIKMNKQIKIKIDIDPYSLL
ncbi:MAG: primosomal protein N' [Candidatus Cloacimonetes bacterium]|nr:primosomal protein N' [Candidatus Cloacimonadota bacterium]